METWIEPEQVAYPSGGFLRRARVRIRENSYDPTAVPASLIGKYRIVRASIPDTFFSIPARLRVAGKTVKGFISQVDGETELTFTPENRNTEGK